MYEPDVPMLRKLVDWVEEEAKKPPLERTWNQRVWTALKLRKPSWGKKVVYFSQEYCEIAPEMEGYVRCGTAYCIAGKRCEMEGYEFSRDGSHVKVGRHWIPVPQQAGELLGLHDFEEEALFEANNDARRVRRIAERIAGRVGERL